MIDERLMNQISSISISFLEINLEPYLNTLFLCITPMPSTQFRVKWISREFSYSKNICHMKVINEFILFCLIWNHVECLRTIVIRCDFAVTQCRSLCIELLQDTFNFAFIYLSQRRTSDAAVLEIWLNAY